MKNIDLRALGTAKMKEQGRLMDAFPWQSREVYAEWIAQTYHFVCHSTRLLALSASRFSVAEDAFHLRFLEHLREEKNHDKLALSDLRALGHDISDHPEQPETRAFWQGQYYLVEHVSPKALFGYIWSLEELAATKGRSIYKELCRAHGEPASVFMKVHAEEDLDHVEKLYEQLQKLEGRDRVIVAENFEQSCVLYGHMLDKVVKVAQARDVRKAA
jgi:thiaminase